MWLPKFTEKTKIRELLGSLYNIDPKELEEA